MEAANQFSSYGNEVKTSIASNTTLPPENEQLVVINLIPERLPFLLVK